MTDDAETIRALTEKDPEGWTAEKAALQMKLAETEKAMGMFKALFTKWMAEERASVDAAIAAAKDATDAN